MIPYIHVPDLTLGSAASPVLFHGIKLLPITLHPFGLLVMTGVYIGVEITVRRGRKKGYDTEKLSSFIRWMLLWGFVLSHMIDEVFYHPEELVARPWSLFMVWEGISSFGGFIGAIVGVIAWKYLWWDERRFGLGFFRVRPQPLPIFAFADLVISVFPIAWAFGRTGCSVVHDHPGARASADTLLAVAYPAPGELAPRVTFGPIEFLTGTAPRYDLGLLELMFTILVASIVATTWRKRLPVGTYLVVISLAYAPVRFVMDYFRIPETDGQGADLRYGSLTFAQWCCIALAVMAIVLSRYVASVEARGIDAAALVRREPALPPREPDAPLAEVS